MTPVVAILLSGLRRLLTDEEAQDLVEYALLVGLLAIGSLAAVQGLGAAVVNVFTNVSSGLAAS